MPDITIISANNNSPEFSRLLVESIRKFTDIPYEIIVADSGSAFLNRLWLREQPDIHVWEAKRTIDRQDAIHYGLANSDSPYLCFLDIDSHLLRRGWAKELIDLYEGDDSLRLITHGGKTGCHPSLVFADRQNMSQISVEALDDTEGVTALTTGDTPCRGKQDTYYLNDKPTFYHFGFGSRFHEHDPPRKLSVSDYYIGQYFVDKRDLWKQPLVQELLGITPHMADQTLAYKSYLLCRDMMSLNNGLPWIEPGAVEILEGVLDKDSTVLEVGAGASTAWFAERVKHVLSFENNRCWYAVVKDDLEVRGIKNVDLLLCPKYPTEGLEFGGVFDVVLIDGPTVGRTQYIKDTIRHVKPGGLFIVDDAQRCEYDEGLKTLDTLGWKHKDFYGKHKLKATSVWEVT